MRLTVRDVEVVLGGQVIVQEAWLTVAEHQVVGILGPNGSGKSTLLRAIYRVLRPRSGTIHLADQDVWAGSARESARRTAVVVQEPLGEFDFGVLDVVAMGRAPHHGVLGRTTRTDEHIVADALARVDATALAHRSFASLSGGEKQRVLLARALAQQPRLLVLDEPTNHLDVRHQLEMLELVRTLGTTTIAALHDLNLAAAYCDRVCVLDAGRIVAVGTPAEVLQPPLIRSVFGVDVAVWRDPVTDAVQLPFRPLARARPASS